MPTRELRARARRRVIRRRRQVAGSGLLLLVSLLALVGFRLAASRADDAAAATLATKGITNTASKPSGASPSTPSASLSMTASAGPTSVRATGRYAHAPGSSDRVGSGSLRTYRVEVETGTEQDAPAFAAAVDATLADPRSWTGKGAWSLQRVSSAKAHFVIRLATPATVDKVCAGVGLDTGGYVSCRAGRLVMINRDRWLRAIPDYNGDVALYRDYVINHEVGHQLGYNHQACPGAGRPAPLMQQQTLGLKGCRPNAWPYDVGVPLPGPATG